eukprot:15367884-Alexandrium_andersonii.AAC.1
MHGVMRGWTDRNHTLGSGVLEWMVGVTTVTTPPLSAVRACALSQAGQAVTARGRKLEVGHVVCQREAATKRWGCRKHSGRNPIHNPSL